MADFKFEDMSFSMVQYTNPVVVSKQEDKKNKQPAIPGMFESKYEVKRETEHLLNTIFPPHCWEENGQQWRQTVSTMPATRQDVLNLQELLDTRLQKTQARETGICSVRRAIYSDCFDEVIRQVTINCSERGLLLLRIRDEVAMSLDAYVTLYSSAVAYGIRKALQAHEEKESLRGRIKDLEIAKDSIEEVIESMKLKFEKAQNRSAELFAAEEKKYAEENAFMKKAITQLKFQLESIVAPKK